MNTKHISLAFVAASALLAGCAKSPIEEVKPSEQFTDLELSYVGATETKVAIDGTTFPEDGEIGLFLFKDEEATQPYGESGYTNVKYSYSSSKGKWTASPSMKVGSTKGYLYGYYPYSSEAADITAIPVKSSLDGDDAMYATKKTVTDQTASQTAITMNHALARISLTVINNGYSGDAELTEISFSGAEIAESGKLNAINGIITAEKSDVTLEVPEDCQSIKKEGTTYECLLVPSDEISGKQDITLTLTIDGQEKTAALSEDTGVIFARNTKSNITITLSNSGISVKTVSVEDWNVVEVGGHKVTIKLSEDDDEIEDDVLTRVKVDENTVEILAISLSGERLECTLDDAAEADVERDIDMDDTFTFTISEIGSDVTATIGYEERLDVTVTSNNSEWGSASYVGKPYKDETLTFEATANEGYEFAEWQDADGNKLDWENPQEITLESGLEVKAVFNVYQIPGSLPGKFLVDLGPDYYLGTDDDKYIYFSQGNLQAKYCEADKRYNWSFAPYQYDFIGNNPGNTTIKLMYYLQYLDDGLINDDNAVVDLFCFSTLSGDMITYGTWAYNTYSSFYGGTFLDWGTRIDDGETWRTPSRDEWEAIFYYNNYRLDVMVNGHDHCCVLYPQGYDQAKIVNSRDKETYNTEAAYNAATKEGVVFLPPSGYRRFNDSNPFNTYIEVNECWNGYYWTSEDCYIYGIQLDNNGPQTWFREWGAAVRLITDCKY